jgi:hypothetical protein
MARDPFPADAFRPRELNYWSIEVCDGVSSAQAWRTMHSQALLEAAVTHGAQEWVWVDVPFGVVMEVGFTDVDDWLRFRQLPAVTAALDAVPDPVRGLFIYAGRGGSAGATLPRRRPQPLGAGAAPLPRTPPTGLVRLASEPGGPAPLSYVGGPGTIHG